MVAGNGVARAPLVSAAGSNGRAFVYLDPPYLRTARATQERIYRHEFTEAQHVELLGVIRRLPCPVAISGYWSPLYAEALHDWRAISFPGPTRGARWATEWLWMNYPEPTELHDYRFLGDDKRERERIARKVRVRVNHLRKVPLLERQAIVEGILNGDRNGTAGGGA